jgi:hypothetical protein
VRLKAARKRPPTEYSETKQRSETVFQSLRHSPCWDSCLQQLQGARQQLQARWDVQVPLLLVTHI